MPSGTSIVGQQDLDSNTAISPGTLYIVSTAPWDGTIRRWGYVYVVYADNQDPVSGTVIYSGLVTSPGARIPIFQRRENPGYGFRAIMIWNDAGIPWFATFY